MANINTDKIVNFLFEIASLRRLTRSHRQVIQEVSDNISDHSFRVAVIGMILAESEKCDINKVLKMCLFHDIVEARTGDANYINKIYIDLHEKEAREDQMVGLPIAREMLKILEEYEERKSKEAIIAKDADVLDQMILEQEYFYKDKKNRKIWQNHKVYVPKTKSAKKLAEKIMKSNPLEWVYQLAEEKNGIKIKREY
ncbi:MAG TPA: HD domain-containing protein [Candidatus Parcubacteria bacterium]|jgi:putative hydrolase of HD superfamily|nr:HD domain-containing protein [Candidatus Parcubacteria bacterium]|tara:strand:- start:450 stop:1043 length:594 start_codon:yes stop_codon:yes gene_type:complete